MRLAPVITAGVLILSCGARSELEVGMLLPSAAFCEEAEYRGGVEDLSLYVLLDRSSSMTTDGKWAASTAALSAYATDPAVAGTGLGLQLYPRSGSCDPDVYTEPLVPIAPLPENAPALEEALAGVQPAGVTPTAPALHGVISHARGLLLGDPSHAIAIALIGDGSSNTCDSSTAAVASIAAHGASEDPRVLTFVISLTSGDIGELTAIAAAGGTGEPIFITSEGTAQQMVDAFKELRDSYRECKYAVPDVEGFVPMGSDITVTTQLDDSGSWSSLRRVGGPGACSGPAFYVDDEQHPTKATLCPASCSAVQTGESARVRVTAGCGRGSGGATGAGGGGNCPGIVDFSCLPECGASGTVQPVCGEGGWRCPEGTVPSDSCTLCPPVPHGCCVPGGLSREASCIDGAWVCPAGGVLFGSPSCVPPAQCAATMPCATGMVCVHGDALCGDELIGSCEQKPATCAAGPDACGCNGATYDSVCDARQSGIDVSISESCPAPAGMHRCGPLFCTSDDQICRVTIDLSDPGPDIYDCVAAPPGCMTTGCDCGLCLPCPPGKTCNEACTGDLVEREVSCFIAG